MSNQGSTPDWRDARRPESYGRHRHGGSGSWVAGAILIVLGAIFLMQNLGYALPYRWWAVFVLLPAVICLGSAWSIYRRNGGYVSPPVISLTVVGLLLAALAVSLFSGFSLGKYWPVILIVLGLAALLGGRWRHRAPPV